MTDLNQPGTGDGIHGKGTWSAILLASIWTTAAALATTAAFCSKWAWPFVFIVLPLAAQACKPQWSWRWIFLAGWIYGIITMVFLFAWLGPTLYRFGGHSLLVAILATLLFDVYHGLVGALWFIGIALGRRYLHLHDWLLFPLIYVPVEHFFPVLFPWQLGLPLRHAHLLLQMADFTGAVGLTFVVALVGGALSDVATDIQNQTREKKRHPVRWRALSGLFVSALLLSIFAGYGYWRIQQIDHLVAKAGEGGHVVTIGIVQPNVAPTDQPQRGPQWIAVLHSLSDIAVKKGAQLVVWPETAIQYRVNASVLAREISRNKQPGRMSSGRMSSGHRSAFPEWIPMKTTTVLTGGRIEERIRNAQPRRYNSAFLISHLGGVLGAVSKNRLLMFGEYLPLESYFPNLRHWFPHAGDMSPGKKPGILNWYGVRIGVAICYEDVLAGYVRQLMQHNPYVLMNVTNDHWFGHSSEPWLHLGLASLRAVESRRFLVRSTMDGISAIVSPTGRIVRQAAPFRRAVIVDDVPLLTGRTFFVRYGPWLVYACLLLLLLAVASAIAKWYFAAD